MCSCARVREHCAAAQVLYPEFQEVGEGGWRNRARAPPDARMRGSWFTLVPWGSPRVMLMARMHACRAWASLHASARPHFEMTPHQCSCAARTAGSATREAATLLPTGRGLGRPV